ncbi:MAG: HAMP domain-containing histidine kinase, partial [Lachnospiraceae bacterium]|nr:HAMP domain-containing histidine kinase [Lachnospiraceae bacterium]
DFSVYIPPTHTADRMDYLDATILNINAMVEELGSIETLKTDFISNVSHEMKTPIAIIKNSAQLIEKGNLSEEERDACIRDIDAAAGRMSDLITNILKLNKLENQKIAPMKEPYDVCRQLCDCILLYDNILDDKELELEVDMEDRAYVLADEQLMELVWNNLLSNAVKFTPKGGKITVTQTTVSVDNVGQAECMASANPVGLAKRMASTNPVGQTERVVRVTVADTGCGMNEESRKHIFDRFYQGDTSHATQGNGLGLALAKRVLELLDGEITVKSIEGEGSAFTVTLQGVRPDGS